MKTVFFALFLSSAAGVSSPKEAGIPPFFHRCAAQQWVFGIMIMESDEMEDTRKKTVASDLAASAFDFWYVRKLGLLGKDIAFEKILEFHILAAMTNSHFLDRMNDPLHWNMDTRRIIGKPRYDWEARRDRETYDALVLEFKNYFNDLKNKRDARSLQEH